MYKLIPFVICFLTLTSVGFSQERVVSLEEFAVDYSTANEKAKEFPRIHNSELTGVLEGSTNKKTWKWEYGDPYNSRLVFTKTDYQGSSRLEMVSISESTFCKADDGPWVKTAAACPSRLFWMGTQLSSMMQASATSQFRVEDVEEHGQKLKKYSELARLPKKSLAGREFPPQNYESIFWVDAVGRITKQEYRSLQDQTKKITTTWIDTFIYDQKIKVLAPIK